MPDTTKRRQRTCIGCGQRTDKNALLRVVRGQDGTLSFDATGRVPGRGAYVCSPECFEGAAKGRKLQRALKTGVTAEEIERVASDIERAVREGSAR